ncbi:facilitated trehalose transporter Tret1 [Halyomorpha halys]|uniref:facilitated trehalose transporter Tret1 n=1 Tax=Halyomorpha halys TaxID=286706 RepID=UPI0006D4E016|nr:facilitated trehalose transporter Tret1 [Halyomorpha halys]
MILPQIPLGAIRQLLASFTCSLSIGMVGAALVWYAPLMLLLVSDKSPIPMTTSQTSWLVSSIEGGSILATIPAGMLANKVGRKYPILVCGPLCAMSYLLQAYTYSLPVLFIIRQIQGICLGVVYTCGPVYIAEVSEPQFRGFNLSNMLTMLYLGGLFSYSVGPYVNYTHYALASLAIPLIFTISFAFMPESPYYLVMKGKHDKAQKALIWLRGDTKIEELKIIQDTIQKETTNKGSWRELFLTRKERKAFLIVQICCITKYLGGITPFVVYVSQTFGEATIDYLDHNQLTIAAGIILSLAAFVSSLITDSVGRRPMLINSCLVCFFFYGLIAVYYFMDSKTEFDMKPYVMVLYLSVIGFIIASTIGLAPLMQTIQAEYFTANTRGLAGGLTSAIATVVSFIALKQYQFISDKVGVYLNYSIYALVSLWGSVCMYYFLPETAGRSLGEIQMEMSGRNKK